MGGPSVNQSALQQQQQNQRQGQQYAQQQLQQALQRLSQYTAANPSPASQWGAMKPPGASSPGTIGGGQAPGSAGQPAFAAQAPPPAPGGTPPSGQMSLQQLTAMGLNPQAILAAQKAAGTSGAPAAPGAGATAQQNPQIQQMIRLMSAQGGAR